MNRIGIGIGKYEDRTETKRLKRRLDWSFDIYNFGTERDHKGLKPSN
jgi:hypothetical protein